MHLSGTSPPHGSEACTRRLLPSLWIDRYLRPHHHLQPAGLLVTARRSSPWASMDRQVPETSLPPVVCRLVRHHRSLKDAELLLAGLPQLVFLLRTHCVGRKCVNGGVPRVLNGSSRPRHRRWPRHQRHFRPQRMRSPVQLPSLLDAQLKGSIGRAPRNGGPERAGSPGLSPGELGAGLWGAPLAG